MDERKIRAIIRAIERVLGNPLEADAQEVEALFAEFGEGTNPAQTVFDLASKAAQKYRLEGAAVPAHVAEALKSAKRMLSGEDSEPANPQSVIDAVLNPMLGPVQEVSCQFRNRKERTQKDQDLLEKLSGEVRKDWSEDTEK